MIGVPTLVDICPPKFRMSRWLATIQGNSDSIGRFEKSSLATEESHCEAARDRMPVSQEKLNRINAEFQDRNSPQACQHAPDHVVEMLALQPAHDQNKVVLRVDPDGILPAAERKNA